MSDDSITVKILAELREDIRGMRTDARDMEARLGERLDQTNGRLDNRIERLDNRIERLDNRIDQLRGDLKSEITASETRIATRQTDHTAATRDLYDLIQDRLQLRDRVEQLEYDVANLKDR